MPLVNRFFRLDFVPERDEVILSREGKIELLFVVNIVEKFLQSILACNV